MSDDMNPDLGLDHTAGQDAADSTQAADAVFEAGNSPDYDDVYATDTDAGPDDFQDDTSSDSDPSAHGMDTFPGADGAGSQPADDGTGSSGDDTQDTFEPASDDDTDTSTDHDTDADDDRMSSAMGEPHASDDPSAEDSATSSQDAEPDAPSAEDTYADDASSDGPASADPQAGDASSGASEPDSASTDAGGDLTVSIDGEDIVVGPPTLDITGDGVADTVVVESEGNVEYYVDTDQDGIADQIIVLDENDGTLVNHEVYDPQSGTWTNVTEESSGSQN